MHPKFLVYSSYGAQDFGNGYVPCHEPFCFGDDIAVVQEEILRVWNIDKVQMIMVFNQHMYNADFANSGSVSPEIIECNSAERCASLVADALTNENKPSWLVTVALMKRDNLACLEVVYLPEQKIKGNAVLTS